MGSIEFRNNRGSGKRAKETRRAMELLALGRRRGLAEGARFSRRSFSLLNEERFLSGKAPCRLEGVEVCFRATAWEMRGER